MLMRAQFSLEMLLAFAAAFLIISWATGYVTAGLTPDAPLAVKAEHLAAVQRIASAADSACLHQASITLPAPCVHKGRLPLIYTVSATSDGIALSSPSGNATAHTGCAVDVSSLPALLCPSGTLSATGPTICAQPFGSGSKLLAGACP